jgi:hypothetical protein
MLGQPAAVPGNCEGLFRLHIFCGSPARYSNITQLILPLSDYVNLTAAEWRQETGNSSGSLRDGRLREEGQHPTGAALPVLGLFTDSNGGASHAKHHA